MTKKEKLGKITKNLDDIDRMLETTPAIVGTMLAGSLIMKILGGMNMKLDGLDCGCDGEKETSVTKVEIKEVVAGVISAFFDEYQNKLINLECDIEDKDYKIEMLEKERENDYQTVQELKKKIEQIEDELKQAKKGKKKK